MTKIDDYEAFVLAAFEGGMLKSVATRGEMSRMKAAARATALKDRRVNIRMSSSDLQDIQVKAMEEGLPYQTLISSVLHKYVTGQLTASATGRSKTPTRRISRERPDIPVARKKA